MKVILLQDVPKIGKRWQIKTVADGFARNHLLPRGLAKIATPPALRDLENKIAKDAESSERELAQMQDLASRLDGLELEMATKVSSKGESYSAITEQKIAQVLDSMGYGVKKSQVKIAETIKSVGEHNVLINLNHGLEAEIKVIVVEEKPLGEEVDS